MAGVLSGHFIKNVQPSNFDYNKSIEILVIVVLGGMGSINGSVIAAIILQLLPELLREFADLRMLVYSVVLILLMILNESPQFADLRGRMNVKNIVQRTKSLVARRKQENKAEKKEGM